LKLDGSDANCNTGIRSLGLESAGGKDQVCCPTYCKECSDHPGCGKTFGAATSDSSNACCASTVLELFTEGKVKSCDDSLPPCKLAKVDFTKPPPASAEADCDKAREDMNQVIEANMKAAP